MNTAITENEAIMLFTELRTNVEKVVVENLRSFAKYDFEPSKHFLVVRSGTPGLRLDVELESDSQSIKFATSNSPKSIGRFDLRLLADGSVQLFNGTSYITVEKATSLLLEPFLNSQAIAAAN